MYWDWHKMTSAMLEIISAMLDNDRSYVGKSYPLYGVKLQIISPKVTYVLDNRTRWKEGNRKLKARIIAHIAHRWRSQKYKNSKLDD